MSPEDRLLIEEWTVRRNPASFEKLVYRYENLVYRAALRIMRDPARANDVAQDCFITLLEKPPRNEAPLGAWLHRVATHRAIDQQRSDSRRTDRERAWSAANASEPSGDAPGLWAELEEHVAAAIDGLPAHEREALIAHYLEGETHEAIAQDAGVSRPAVTQRLHRALESLRKRLGATEGALSIAALDAALLHGRTQDATAAVGPRLLLDGSGLQRGVSDAARTTPRSPGDGRPHASVSPSRNLLMYGAVATIVLASVVTVYFRSTHGTTETDVARGGAAAISSSERNAAGSVTPPPNPAPAEPPLQIESSYPESASPDAEMTQGPQVFGRVYNATTDAGIAEVSIGWSAGQAVRTVGRNFVEADFFPSPQQGAHGAGGEKFATTAADGSYSVGGLSPGTYAVFLENLPPRLRLRDSNTPIINLSETSGSLELNIPVVEGGTVTGRLMINGEPVPRASALFDSEPNLPVSEVSSDSQGVYRIEGLAPFAGSVRSRMSLYGTRRATPYIKLFVEDGKTTTLDLDFLAGTSSVEGNLYFHTSDGSVEPVRGRMVATYHYVNDGHYNIENMDIDTDEAGHFRIDGLWAGEVTLGVYPDLRFVHRQRQVFDLGEGETTTKDFHFYDTRIEVSVEDVPDAPNLDYWLVAFAGDLEFPDIERADLRAFIDAHQLCVGSVRVASGTGTGALGGLPPGEYQIMASGVPSGSHSLQDHAAGDEFYSRRKRTALARVTLSDGAPVTQATLRFDSAP